MKGGREVYHFGFQRDEFTQDDVLVPLFLAE